jgi:PAS domain S-box-containing protein
MDEKGLENSYLKFLTHLVTAIRKISLYPLKHPSVVSSMNAVYASLSGIITAKNSLGLNVSPGKKIIINDTEVNDKGLGAFDVLSPPLRQLDIEDITFSTGITQKEIEDFLRLVIVDQEQAKKSPDINKALLDNAIQHIKIEQFSYVKIKKDQETVVLGREGLPLDKLKSKIKDYCDGKIVKVFDVENIERELFGAAFFEFKEKKGIGVSLKNLFKRFLLRRQDQAGIMDRLKTALLDFGASGEDVEKIVKKIEEEIARKPKEKAPEARPETVAQEQKESPELKEKTEKLRRDLEAQAGLLEQLKKQNQLLLEEKGRIDNIVHHMADGMVVIGPQGNILMANPSAEALLGISKQDIGKPIKEVVKDEHLLTLVRRLPSEKEAVVEEDIELFSSSESTKKVLRTSSAVVEDHNGKTVGMVTILNDITKQRELEKIKSDFLANVSHELRTPLVAMEKSISLLITKAAGEVNPDQQQFLDITQRNLKRLSLLINDLLDLSKLEAGKMQLRPEPASIEKVINESVEGLMVWAKTKSINIEKRISEGLPELNVDSNRLIQVLNNLIGNAIKFTPAGGRITILAQHRLEHKTIEVSVEDTGIGIPPEDLPKIFSKFYQVSERAPTDISGTGIGLAISKEIVELHGGKIWAESQHSQGAKFSFTLPVTG